MYHAHYQPEAQAPPLKYAAREKPIHSTPKPVSQCWTIFLNEGGLGVFYPWTVILRFLSFRQLVPAFLGGFCLLSAFGQIPDVKREHRSTLGLPFVSIPGTPALLATYETRVSDWQAFIQASGREWTYKPHFEQGPDHPVVGVTLEDARAFCTWLTEKERADGHLNAAQLYRLPTRADWDAAVGLLRMRKLDLTVEEKVADERAFPWGANWPPPANAANFAEGEIPGYSDSFPFTAPVGQFKASAEGVYDLAGNVWEWCWDPQVRVEQVGVLRGGSWAYFRAECLRSDYVYTVPVDMRMPTIGFRCVFEDKQRTATMLASAEKIKAEIRSKRREEIMGGAVTKDDLAAMKEKLKSTGTAAATTNAPLKPAEAGQAFSNDLGMNFVPLPGTSLLMGSVEVRVQDYEAWLKASDRAWENKAPFLLTPEHAAVGISWDEATAFCTWLTERDRASKLIPANASYRLPTDVEWSRAAGLSDETGADPAQRHEKATLHFPWSAEGTFPPPSSSTNLDATRMEGYRDSFSYTAPVITEAANALGIQGLGGNAAEWCQDVWPGAQSERVVRGGSWLMHAREQLRTGHRQHIPRDSRNNSIGFRVVLEFSTP